LASLFARKYNVALSIRCPIWAAGFARKTDLSGTLALLFLWSPRAGASPEHRALMRATGKANRDHDKAVRNVCRLHGVRSHVYLSIRCFR
jgi:hypothetical protein